MSVRFIGISDVSLHALSASILKGGLVYMPQELQPEMAALDLQDVPVGVTADPVS